MKSVSDRVTAILTEQLSVDVEAVTPAATLVGDLGADSLDVIEVVMACEDEFGITIPDEDAETLSTVQSVVDYLAMRTGAAKP